MFYITLFFSIIISFWYGLMLIVMQFIIYYAIFYWIEQNVFSLHIITVCQDILLQ